MLVSFSRWVKAPVALAAAGVMAAVPPAAAGGVRHCEWWLRALHVTTAWATAKGGGVTVAVLDTGVDPAAPDLAGSVTAGADFTRSGRASAGVFWGVHGTAVASLIAGHGHGPGGTDGIAGVAPRAKILSVRVVLERTDPLEDNHALASHQPAAIASGIRYAVRHGARVIALPLDPGQPTVVHAAAPAAAGGSAAEKAAVAYAASRGVVLVAPAGDTGNQADRVNYPAAYPGVISVGAVDRTFAQSPFTSRRPYVTLTAPGQAIVAAIPGGGYTTFSSTSAASAIVAGIAALIKSRYPSLTAAQVKAALIHTTVPHRRGGAAGWRGFWHGRRRRRAEARRQHGRGRPGPHAPTHTPFPHTGRPAYYRPKRAPHHDSRAEHRHSHSRDLVDRAARRVAHRNRPHARSARRHAGTTPRRGGRSAATARAVAADAVAGQPRNEPAASQSAHSRLPPGPDPAASRGRSLPARAR